jgi:hypothetical protein
MLCLFTEKTLLNLFLNNVIIDTRLIITIPVITK